MKEADKIKEVLEEGGSGGPIGQLEVMINKLKTKQNKGQIKTSLGRACIYHKIKGHCIHLYPGGKDAWHLVQKKQNAGVDHH